MGKIAPVPLWARSPPRCYIIAPSPGLFRFHFARFARRRTRLAPSPLSPRRRRAPFAARRPRVPRPQRHLPPPVVQPSPFQPLKPPKHRSSSSNGLSSSLPPFSSSSFPGGPGTPLKPFPLPLWGPPGNCPAVPPYPARQPREAALGPCQVGPKPRRPPAPRSVVGEPGPGRTRQRPRGPSGPVGPVGPPWTGRAPPPSVAQ